MGPDNAGQITGPSPNSQNTRRHRSLIGAENLRCGVQLCDRKPQLYFRLSAIADLRIFGFYGRGGEKAFLPPPLSPWEWNPAFTWVFRNIFFPSLGDKERKRRRGWRRIILDQFFITDLKIRIWSFKRTIVYIYIFWALSNCKLFNLNKIYIDKE